MRLNFRWKLFIGFCAFALVISGVLTAAIYAQLRDLPIKLTREVLMAAVAQAAPRISARDVAALLGEASPEKNEALARVRRVLTEIDQAPPHFQFRGGDPNQPNGKDVYILGPSRKEGVGILLAALNPEEVGRAYDMERFPQMMKGWTLVTADTRIGNDEYGRTLSAYAPILDDQNRTVALLGIDAPGAFIDSVKHALMLLAWAVFFLSVIFAAPVAFFIASRMNRPIRLLSEGMTRVAAGDLSATLPAMRTRDEFETLMEKFNQMVIHLRERQQLKRSLEFAQDIQRHLLPAHPPAVLGFEIADYSDYCEETGGDYFDYVELPEADGAPRRLGFVVGDVTGHGIAAALLMASTRAVLRANAWTCGHRLDRLLHEMNVHLVRDTDGSRFVTLFYGMICPRDRSLCWASAGHEPGLLYRAADASVQELDSTGLPLGVDLDMEFTQSGPLTMNKGDVLVVVTDGIRESKNEESKMFGRARLNEVLRKNGAHSARTIHAAIVEAVHDFRGPTPQLDDITLVVIKAV